MMRNNPENATQAEKKFMTLFEEAPVGYLILEKDGTIRELNQTAVRLLGRDRPELLSTNLGMFAVNGGHATIESFLTKIFRSKSEVSCEVSLSANGNGALFFHLGGVQSPDVDGALVTLTDITQRKQQEDSLQKALEDSEESGRMKLAFLSDLSHEIRTPLHGILSFLQLIYKENFSDPKQEKIFQIIKKNADQLLTIITGIIDLSKIESNQFKLNFSGFNLNNLLEDILSVFENENKSYHKDKITLTLEKGLPDDKSHLYCDQSRLTQVLNNLIGNALKFTTEGSVCISYRFENGELVFSIRDTGKGIPEKRQETIFNRFRSTEVPDDFESAGIGIGLPVSKGIIELMGGRMWLTSKEGEGSVFYFSLPGKTLASPSGKQHPAALPRTEDLFKGKTILVAEDLAENFAFIEAILNDSGAHLLQARNGQEAIERCLQHPEIDLVLMDVRMPLMNGLKATGEIRKIRPDLHVIAVTAYCSQNHETKCQEAGCIHMITKPFTKKQLVSVLQKYLVK